VLVLLLQLLLLLLLLLLGTARLAERAKVSTVLKRATLQLNYSPS
jgi:hypothetical protein